MAQRAVKRQPWKGYGGSRHVGRLRIEAAKILSKSLGFTVDPSNIVPVTGAWRTNAKLDVYRWELFTRDSEGLALVAGCWDSLTDFVKHAKKHGCEIKNREVVVTFPQNERHYAP
jgi:hypothetical protein